MALANLGRYQEAIDNCDKATELKPDDYSVWCKRGFAMKKAERYGEAILDCERALGIDPSNAWAYYIKASCYALQGEADEAVLALQQAIALYPAYQEIVRTNPDFDNIRVSPPKS